MQLNKNSKIFVAGHKGMVGSSIVRYLKKKKAIEKYYDLAKENGMSLTTMALSFVNDRSFVTSNIIGATSIDQLKENIDSYKVFLSDELLDKINIIHNNQPNPAP